MKKYLSYKKFIYIVIFLSIVIISGLFLLYTSFIHLNSIKESIKEDSNVMTELIFQNLYTVMKSGGNKELINTTIMNLEKKVPHIKVNVVQNSSDTSSEIIRNSFLTKKSEILQKDFNIQFVAPILFSQECLLCHKKSHIDDVAGVIFMEHSILDVKLSFQEIILMTFILFLIVILVFLNMWFYFLKKYFINPIQDLISQISIHQTHNDSKTKIFVNSRIREIKLLERSFNIKNKQLFKSYNKLKKSNYIDSLTGIFNRKKFDEYSILTFNNAQRNNISFSIIMIDLNKFKFINDTYGHQIGDSVLILFSKTIKETIRDTDYFFRLGGDEFCLILNNTDTIGANIIVKKLQEKLLNTKLIQRGFELGINASFGISQYDLDGNNIDELIKIADTRMYENKKASYEV